MDGNSLTALVVTRDRGWGGQCVDRLLTAGCDVHKVSDGLRGIDLLRKQIYDLVIVDDSLNDVSPVEFTLNLRELAPNAPIYIVAGAQFDAAQQLRRLSDVFFAGPAADALARIDAAVTRAALASKAGIAESQRLQEHEE